MKVEERKKAQELRKNGYSLKEIAELLRVSKSSVSLWVSDVSLSKEAKDRLDKKVTDGQRISAESRKNQTKVELLKYYSSSLASFSYLPKDKAIFQFFCSLLYLCEGGKHGNNFVQFTNSDSKLIMAFLKLLRDSFRIEERKFRVCIHLHNYHDVDQQLGFWAGITQIPRGQFIKPYIKKSEHKHIHKEYQGCCQIRYYSSEVNKELTMAGIACLDSIIGS